VCLAAFGSTSKYTLRRDLAAVWTVLVLVRLLEALLEHIAAVGFVPGDSLEQEQFFQMGSDWVFTGGLI